MGLDCSHGAWSGQYSAFNRLRRAIANALGGSWPPHEDDSLDEDTWFIDDKWNEEEHKGIFLFMNHSDCDGEFTPDECRLVARDLTEHVAPLLEELGEEQHFSYKRAVERFAAGCLDAANKGERLEFR